MTSVHWDKAYSTPQTPSSLSYVTALVTRSEVHDFTTSNVTYAIECEGVVPVKEKE